MPNLKRFTGALTLALITTAVISVPAHAAPAPVSVPSYRQVIAESDSVQKLSSWPAGPRLAGNEMIAKYGAPNEITDERMIWHYAAPFKRILLTREALPHHFPIVHMDYLEHTISYNVPAGKAGEVLAFDGSITIHRVSGELSARCDLESNNVLTLNLAQEIIEGRTTVEQARQAFGDAVIARANAESPAITADLQFEPQAPVVAADTDTVTIAGAPKPAGLEGASVDTDAETLALLIVSDLDKIHAAMIAKSKTVAEPVLGYVRKMHEAHGEHLRAIVDVGTNSQLTPVMTENVNAQKDKYAAALSDIVLLDGADFGRAYMDFALESHSAAQSLIDERLEVTTNELLRNHLTATRETVAMHLQQAREVKAEATRLAFR